MAGNDATRKRQRDARRLVKGISAVGGRFALLGWTQWALIGCWLPRRLRKKLDGLQLEILLILQQAALEQAQRSELNRAQQAVEKVAPSLPATVH